MSSLEDAMKTNVLSSSKNDPAATDLDYYSKPENYTGSNLQSLQQFKSAKNKEDRQTSGDEKKKVVKDAQYYFFNRYKHLLHDAIFVDDLLDREKEESSEEEEEIEIRIISEETKEERAKKKLAKDLITITEEDEESPVGGIYVEPPARSRMSLEQQSDKLTPVSPASSMFDDSRGTPESPTSLSAKSKSKSMSAGRQSTAIMRVKMDEMSRKIRAKQLYEKFQKAVRGIKAICRLASSARGKQGGGASAMRTFLDIAGDETTTEDNMRSQGLSFDPNYFKAIREISLSSETKAILTMPSERRSPEQVQTAMFGLQSLRSYAEYPLHMQEKLANVAWYEVVAPKRIIIRQGHVAENFYFILSGQAVVTILLRNPKTGASFLKTAMVMKKGMSFGELALLHHSKRTATVTSQDTVQLLSIGREDFFDIFMASSGPDAIPDHIKFISNIDFMKDWPLQQLVEHPEHCLLHFFKRNTVIVSNSNQSDWMYIIKSGSCQVLKKLKGVTANSQPKQKWQDKLETIPKSKLKAMIFAPKVDSGLHKRRKTTDCSGDDSKQDANDQEDDNDKSNKDTRYSKENYSKNPSTKKAHFSAKSSFAKRKGYTPPKKNVPKKPEGPQEPPTPKSLPPVFVQVSNLKPRDVFGLESVEFYDDIQLAHTAVTLISRGAECVMLSKAFYTKHANELVKKSVRHTIRPYPDEDVFQENLQIKEDWFVYKKVLLNDVTSQITEQHPRLKKR